LWNKGLQEISEISSFSNSNEKRVAGVPGTLDLLFSLYQFCSTHTDTIFGFIFVADSLGCEKNIAKRGLTGFRGRTALVLRRQKRRGL
jgi:hypothetical protein